MLVLSHRGYWKTPEERNMPIAFERSFALGFGTETDVRDLDGELVISHDPPRQGCLTLRAMLEVHRKHSRTLPLALNIKSDGIQEMLTEVLRLEGIDTYFCFDMSIPDTRAYAAHDIRFYTRQSEFEPMPAFYAEAEGVWLDAFESEWYDGTLIAKHLDNGKKVCIVSPELHKREYRALWQRLKEWDRDGIMLCTDFPVEARAYFNGQD